VSHTFIRREIHAIETLGMTVRRYALRPGQALVDPEDIREREITRYILGAGAWEIICCSISMLLRHPFRSTKALVLALRMGWRSDRGIFRHLAYLIEAAVLASWCCRDDIQHLHAHFGTNPAVIAALTRQLSGISYSFTAHGPDEFERAPRLSLALKLEHANFVVCVSAFGRSQYMRWVPHDLWSKIVVIHCGLDSRFLDEPLTPPASANRFICVGRLCEQKAQLVLLAAAVRLRDARTPFHIVLAGDGPLRGVLEETIRKAGLEDHVDITGWVSGDRVRREIVASRALVLPSFAENMPVVIMEAMALGRPVISTYIAGIPELVEPGRTGWLVPAGEDIALAAAMQAIIDAPVESLVAMGIAGRAHIRTQHDSRAEAGKLKALFESSH